MFEKVFGSVCFCMLSMLFINIFLVVSFLNGFTIVLSFFLLPILGLFWRFFAECF
mgnify:CR=1 FL=1